MCCFVAIYQEQLSPISVVSSGSAATVLGWVLWDCWVRQEEAAKSISKPSVASDTNNSVGDNSKHAESALGGQSRPPSRGREPQGLGLTLSTGSLPVHRGHSRSQSANSVPSASSVPSPTLSQANVATELPPQHVAHAYHPQSSIFSPRNQQRLATAKSAILIYCALLGLSPILKSLTMSTSSDSIWAMSCWLMCINIFFFDYGGGVGVKYVLGSLIFTRKPIRLEK